jgi:hypothetical protein
MVGQPQMLPQPIPRVPVEENISEISDSGFGMPDPRMNMMEPRMMMADGEEADITDFLNASPQMRLSGIDARLGELQREFDQAQINGDIPRQTMLNEQINETIKERVNVMGMIGDMQRQADMKMAAGGEAKPDFLDFDKDGNKEESMKDALKDRDGFAVGGLSAAARSLNAPRNLARAAALTAAAGYGAGKVMEGPISQALESFTPENLGAFVAQGKLTFDEALQRAKELASPVESTFDEAFGRAKELGQEVDTEIRFLRNRIQNGYEAELANQRQQEINRLNAIDASQGLVPVFAEGDEVSMMMMEMEEPAGEAKDAMAEVADIAPAAQALDQYVNMVIEMIQAGAGEAEIIKMLQEAGLDEADINAVFQAVLEAMQGPSINSELAALG